MPSSDNSPLRFVVYYRTGLPTLSLDKQRSSVECHAWFRAFEELGNYTEIETRKMQFRPQLDLAVNEAHRLGADILIADISLMTLDIAFLDFINKSERLFGVKMFAVGLLKGEYLPTSFLLNHAKRAARSHSDRTREGIAASKARGTRMGATGSAHADIARAALSAQAASRRSRHLSVITKIRRANPGLTTLQSIADALTAQGEKTPRGQNKWSPAQVRRVLGPKRKKAGPSNEKSAHPDKTSRARNSETQVLH